MQANQPVAADTQAAPTQVRRKKGAFSAIADAFKPNHAIPAGATKLFAAAWALLFVLWWSTISSPVVPTPAGVLDAFGDLFGKEQLFTELLTSMTLNIEAIALSSLISLVLAYATVLAGVRPVIAFLSKQRFLGLTGLTFVFGLMATGHALKLWLLVFGMSVFLTTSLVAIVAGIPQDAFDDARTLRMSRWRATFEVVVLGTFDQALEAIRQNAAIGWVMLTMVEGLVRSEGGIGTLLLNQNKHLHLDAVFALQITILIVGLLQDYSLGVIRAVACPYAVLAERRK